MTDPVLRHDAFLRPGEAFHLVRAALGPHRPRRLHAQDHPELLWVQNGRVRHHLPDARQDLAEGDVVFVRATDRHALQGRAPETLVVALALRPEVAAALPERHPGLAGRFFWSGAALPEVWPRDMRQLAALNRAALRLERARRDALEAEAFLLPLLAALGDGRADLPPDAPDWLAAALAAAAEPEVFRAGAAGFVRAAGRAHPHVARTTRRLLGKSPSQIVNERRMDWAARRLTGTADSLAEIAADCGIPNLSHFHKLFRARHAMTPLQYRKVRQRDLLHP